MYYVIHFDILQDMDRVQENTIESLALEYGRVAVKPGLFVGGDVHVVLPDGQCRVIRENGSDYADGYGSDGSIDWSL